MTDEIAQPSRPQSTTGRRMAFANWIVSPFRAPATQKELAELWGVAQSTLSDDKKSPEFLAITKDWRESYRGAFVEAVDAMWRKAKDGDVPAFRALSEVLGENAPAKIETTSKLSLVEYLVTRLGPGGRDEGEPQ